jgi:pimeloyl-ACP methyl ester carboxylesterase
MASYPRHRQASQLARWLGPWADASAVPSSVNRSEEQLPALEAEAPAVRAYRYEPAQGAVTGTYVVVQGLHYAGPDDPRMDRFCRVLASAGLCVVAPFLRDYLALRVSPRAASDVAAACEHAVKLCAQRGLPRPALFSISFGSTPAIEVAASERHRDAIGALVLFGGFFDFRATIRFAISARAFDGDRPVTLPHDPLNGPAVFVNLVDHFDTPGPKDALRRAWLEMAKCTWGQPELRPRHKRMLLAEPLCEALSAPQRELFMIGCGLAPGGAALLEVGLAGAGDFFGFTNPSASLGRVGVPVVISHGRDDDVIPYTEAEKLRAALPRDLPNRIHITGMYGHTGLELPRPGEVAGEVGTMLDALYSIIDAPHEGIGS